MRSPGTKSARIQRIVSRANSRSDCSSLTSRSGSCWLTTALLARTIDRPDDLRPGNPPQIRSLAILAALNLSGWFKLGRAAPLFVGDDDDDDDTRHRENADPRGDPRGRVRPARSRGARSRAAVA